MSRAETLPELKPWPEAVEPFSLHGVRYYPLGNRKLVSVTSTEKAANYSSGDFLNAWYEKNGKEAAIEAAERLFEWMQGSSKQQFRAKIEAEIKSVNASKRKMEKAADIGTLVHKKIQWKMRQETGLDPGPEPVMNDEAYLGYESWLEWWNASGLKPVTAEQFIYHEELGYAGSIDLIAMGPDGLELVDWKTSNYILAKHHVQVCAYKHAAELWRPIVRARIVRVPKTLDNLDVEVRELGDTYDMTRKEHVFKTEAEMLSAFMAALEIHRVFFAEPARNPP